MRQFSCLVVTVLLMLLAAPPTAAQVPGLGAITGAGRAGETSSGGAGETTADPVELLLGILQDEDARNRLVEELRSAESGSGAAAAAGSAESGTGRSITDFATEVGAAGISRVRDIGTAVTRAPEALSGIDRDAIAIVIAAVRDLFLVILASVGTFAAFRAAAKPFYRRLGKRLAGRPGVRRILPFIGVALVEFAFVAIALIIGAFVAVRSSEGGELGQTHALYLTAFLAVGLQKLVLRLVLAPATGSLRPLKLSNWAARRLYRIAGTLVGLFGYGFILILPIVSESGFAEARSTAVLIWLLAIALTVSVILHYRLAVGDWLLTQWDGKAAPRTEQDEGGAEPWPEGFGNRMIRALAHGWYLLGLAWILWLLVTILTRRPHILNDLLAASARVALAVLAGLVLSGLLGRLVNWGISLPSSVTQAVPLFEVRLNRNVPRLLFVLRLLILAAVVIFSFATLNIVSARSWFESDIAFQFSKGLFSVAIILLVAFVMWLALTSWVDYRLNRSYGQATAREQTLLTLLRNAGTIAILAFALMFALSEIGLNIGPLLASAGVVGLAIGFGAQKMVQDIITGIFIQFENAINVGDVVAAGGITGAVERLTVRSVSLRDLSGVYHIIPFSSVDVVSNFTRDFAYWVVDMGIAYREDVNAARQAIFDAFDEVRSHPELGGFVLGELEWFGLDSFGDNAVMLKARIKTWPAQQWAVGRAYNEIVKRIFDERGIEIPFPQRTLWFGEDREGNAPPLRVEGSGARGEARKSPTPPPGPEPHEVTRPTQDGPPDQDGE